jgi:hypothetical protein
MHRGYENMAAATAGYQGLVGHVVLRDRGKDAALGPVKGWPAQPGARWDESHLGLAGEAKTIGCPELPYPSFSSGL